MAKQRLKFDDLMRCAGIALVAPIVVVAAPVHEHQHQ